MTKIPKKKPLKKDEIIKILREEIEKKEEEIQKLKEENQLLLNVTYKNAKRQLKDYTKIKEDEKEIDEALLRELQK